MQSSVLIRARSGTRKQNVRIDPASAVLEAKAGILASFEIEATPDAAYLSLSPDGAKGKWQPRPQVGFD